MNVLRKQIPAENHGAPCARDQLPIIFTYIITVYEKEMLALSHAQIKITKEKKGQQKKVDRGRVDKADAISKETT